MSLLLEKEISRLKKQVLSLSALVEENVQRAIRSLKERDPALAERVINSDDQIDEAEVELEEECLKVLALHQPVAMDLRFIIAVLKINNDLERIGDLAVNLAQRAKSLSTQKIEEIPFDFPGMAEKAQAMLHQALDALVARDPGLAHRVCAADNEVDAINRKMYAAVQEKIRSHPDWVDWLIHLFAVSRHLERIADHATNIAEDVIYLCEGKIVRHRAEALHYPNKT